MFYTYLEGCQYVQSLKQILLIVLILLECDNDSSYLRTRCIIVVRIITNLPRFSNLLSHLHMPIHLPLHLSPRIHSTRSHTTQASQVHLDTCTLCVLFGYVLNVSTFTEINLLQLRPVGFA